MKRILLAVFGMFLCFAAQAVGKCPAPEEGGEWDVSCFETVGTERRLKTEHLGGLKFEASGKAVIRIDQEFEMVAVDSSGLVVIPDIAFWGDFDYPNCADDVCRFNLRSPGTDGLIGRKCGFFDQKSMTVIVPPEYDHCLPFDEGKGKVCTDCERYCSPDDCHTTTLVGGKGFVLDRTGKISDIFSPPTLKTVCDSREPPQIWKEGATPFLQCGRASNDPFDGLE